MKRFFVLFLTLVLLFSITIKPMTVHAFDPASATVALGLTAGGATVAVPIAIAVVAVLIIYYCGLEFIKDDLALLVYKAELVYESLVGEAKSWVDSITLARTPTIISVEVSQQLKTAIAQKGGGNPDPKKDGNVFYLPDATMLLTLGAVSTADIISNNALYRALDSMTSVLDNIKQELHDMAFDVVEAIESLGTSIKALPSEISTALSTSFNSLKNSISTLTSTVSTYVNNSATRFENAIKYDVTPFLNSISTRADNLFKYEIEPLIKNFKLDVSNSFATLTSSLSSISTRFENAIQYNITPFLNSISTRFDNLFKFEIEPLINNFKVEISNALSSVVSELKLGFASVSQSVSSLGTQAGLGGSSGGGSTGTTTGINSGTTGGSNGSSTGLPNMKANGVLGMWYFGQAGELLKKYATPLLAGGAIFNLFAEVTFISDLLTFSLSIGIVGALLGIAISAFNKDDKNSAKATKAKRGGTV